MNVSKTNHRFLILGVILTMAFAVSAAADQEGPRRGGRWLERLDLTEEQEVAIAKIQEDAQDQHLELRKEIMRLENERKGELLKDSPSSKTVLDLTRKIGAIKSDLAVARMSTRLAIRDQLTGEQRDRMLMMKGRGEGRERFRGGNRGPRGGRSFRGSHGGHGAGRGAGDPDEL